MGHMRFVSACSISLLLTGIASGRAHAQSQIQDVQPADSDRGGIEDIIVTAEKRSVSSQRAAAAITVIDSDTIILRGIQNVLQIQALAPSLKLMPEGTTTVAFIRGIGVALDLANVDPGISVNFNDVNVPREVTGGANLFDVDRVEVLPGPQGTIYGRSASGGVINVDFKRPGKELGGNLLAEYGNYDYIHLAGAVNLPVNDAMGLRIAANYNKRDGYLASGSGAEDDLGVRISTLIDASDRWSVFVWGSYIAHRGSIANSVNFPFLDPSQPYNDLQPVPLQLFGPVREGRLHQDVYLAGGEVEYSGDNFTVSYIPSYIKAKANHLYFLAGAPADFRYSVDQISNELKITAQSSDGVQLLGGLQQFEETYRDFVLGLPFGNVYDIPVSKLYGTAAYTQAVISLTSKTRATLGGRYSSTRRRASVNEFIAPGLAPRPFTYSKRFNRADWKIGVEADIAAESMAYATVQTGFNPGTYNTNPSVPGLARDLKSTRLISYTAGVKNRFVDNRVQLNVEAFYYDYRDLLVTAVNVLSGGQESYNANKVEIYGVQVDAKFAPTQRTEFHASIGYLHAENKDFVISQPVGPPINLNGLQPIFSPTWTASIGGSHIIAFASGAEILLNADFHIESHSWAQFNHAPGTRTNGFSNTDLSATYTLPDKRLSFTGWVRNVENSGLVSFAASGGIPGPVALGLIRPRTYGVRAGVKF